MKTNTRSAICLMASIVTAVALVPPSAANYLDCQEAIERVQRSLETADMGSSASSSSNGGLADAILDAIDVCGDEGGSESYGTAGEPAGRTTSTFSPTVAGVASTATNCGGGGIHGYTWVTTTFAFKDGHSAVTERGTAFIERGADGLLHMTADGDVFGFESWGNGRGSITVGEVPILATAGSVTPFCLSPGDGICGGDGFARYDGAFTITVQADFNECLSG